MLTAPIAAAFEAYEAAIATPAFAAARDGAFNDLINAESEGERVTSLLSILDDAERATIATLRSARADLESEIHAITAARATLARQAAEARAHATTMRDAAEAADLEAKRSTFARAAAKAAHRDAADAEKAADAARSAMQGAAA